MANIDWDAILAKTKDYLKSTDGTKKIASAVNHAITNGETSDAAAKEFVSLLKKEVASCAAGGSPDTYSTGHIGTTAISAITKDIWYTKPKSIGGDMYEIDIYFAADRKDLHRTSLYPEKYPNGVENIVALLNSGYDTSGRAVHGTWHGHKQFSLTHREGAHFIENAIRVFMNVAGKMHGVVRIEVDEQYGIR